MPLSVVIGSSGSGKTTFLNHANDLHHCTYIRQYHNIRPYVTVSKIPGFDPTQLPYWDLYVNDKKDGTIQAGGTLAGEFTPGLSGGQRKLLLFELVCQRTANMLGLLILFDEPFAGVTDNFVPFIVDRLNILRQKHNIVIVTNDHIEALTTMADNVITVSAIDRSHVKINDMPEVDRQKTLLALSSGTKFEYKTNWEDVSFFLDIEFLNNGAFVGVLIFMCIAFGLYLLAFWGSSEEHIDLVIVAGYFLAFFSLNGWVIALAEWRIVMEEEADALLHASRRTNKVLKAAQTVMLSTLTSVIGFGVICGVVDGFNEFKFFLAFWLDNLAPILAYICFGLYTKLTLQDADIISSSYIMLTIFFSSSFSPGGGVPGIDNLRYIFPRFYFWCMLPGIQDSMEGCPANESHTIAYLVLTTFVEAFLFLLVKVIHALIACRKHNKDNTVTDSLKDEEFEKLQKTVFGDETMKDTTRQDSISVAQSNQ